MLPFFFSKTMRSTASTKAQGCYTSIMLFAFIGAMIGASFGGLPGALIGGIAGYYSAIALQRSVIGGLRVVQSQFFDAIFSIMGALCKADDVVTLHGEQRDQAKAAFSRGKQPDFDLDAAVDEFARVSRGRAPLVQLFLQLQVMAVVADGRVDPAEHAMLVRIARRLGLNEADVSQLEALLRATTGSRSAPDGRSTKDRLSDAYTALGVSPESTNAEIKRAYRKLISKNHPDKLAGRGLPESMRPVAEERSRELNAAYDLLKDARNIK
jgi:DnaJ like chaperone protein